jgi:acyl-CoA thioester hydrolase
MAFEMATQVSWAHLDSNGHMANTAYLDLAVDARFQYFASRGFSPAEFAKLHIGPVVRRDQVDYFKELHLLQAVRVTLELAGLSDDASRFMLRNDIFRPDGERAASITTTGGWFDLSARKLIAPPAPLAQAMAELSRTDDFVTLESSVRKV